MMTKAIRIHQNGGPEVLQWEEVEVGEPGEARNVLQELKDRGKTLPVIVGGRLNEVPEQTNTGLPVDVTGHLAELGSIPCSSVEELLIVLDRLASDLNARRAPLA